MKNEIQKDDVTLPGGIGTVKVGDTEREIVKVESNKKEGSVTLTIKDEMQPLKDYLQGKSSTIEFVEECRQISGTEDAEFEIIQPKQISNGR